MSVPDRHQLMDSHAHTSQAFIPMGKGDRKDAEGGAYIVIGCLNGKDDKPDLSTLRAFLATSSQGVSYDQGIWRELFYTFTCAGADKQIIR